MGLATHSTPPLGTDTEDPKGSTGKASRGSETCKPSTARASQNLEDLCVGHKRWKGCGKPLRCGRAKRRWRPSIVPAQQEQSLVEGARPIDPEKGSAVSWGRQRLKPNRRRLVKRLLSERQQREPGTGPPARRDAQAGTQRQRTQTSNRLAAEKKPVAHSC